METRMVGLFTTLETGVAGRLFTMKCWMMGGPFATFSTMGKRRLRGLSATFSTMGKIRLGWPFAVFFTMEKRRLCGAFPNLFTMERRRLDGAFAKLFAMEGWKWGDIFTIFRPGLKGRKPGGLFSLFTTFNSLDFNTMGLGMGGFFATFAFSNMGNGYRGNTNAQARAFGNGKRGKRRNG